MIRWASALSSALLAVVPVIGVVAMALRTLLTRDTSRSRIRWSLVLGATLLLPVPFQLATGQSATVLVAQAFFAAFMVFVCGGERRGVVVGFLGALAMLLVGGYLFTKWTAPLLHSEGAGLGTYISGKSRLGPGPMYWSTAKEWRVDPELELVEVAMELRLTHGEPGADWYRYNPDMTIEPCEGPSGTGCSGVGVPISADDAGPLNISRELDTGRSLGGRTFRLVASLRSETTQNTEGCAGLVLQENGGAYRGQCQPVALGPDWSQYEVEWTAPRAIAGSELRVLVSDIRSDYEIANVIVQEFVDGGWVELGPLEPKGLQIGIRNQGMSRQDSDVRTIVPAEEWQVHRVLLDSAGLTGNGILRLNFQTEGMIGVELRNLSIQPVGGGNRLRPVAERRWDLGFGQANLFGHSVATTGAAVMSLSESLPIQGLALVGAGVLVLKSGSRAALLALALFTLLHLFLFRRKGAGLVVLAVAIISVAGLYLFAPSALQRFTSFEDGNVVPRSQIRTVALAAMAEQPISGLGDEAFADFWISESGGWPNQAPSHAHNFVLQQAAQYGVPGLVAALTFLVLLARYCWVRRRWKGLVLLAPVLVMSFFDYTLFFAGVLGPLLVAMQVVPGEDRLVRAPRTEPVSTV